MRSLCWAAPSELALNAITCNCLDSVTGQMTGVGLSRDGRVSAKEMATCRGEHWSVTQSNLLGDLRFDERLPGLEDTVWLRVNRIARRYYLHRTLDCAHRGCRQDFNRRQQTHH